MTIIIIITAYYKNVALLKRKTYIHCQNEIQPSANDKFRIYTWLRDGDLSRSMKTISVNRIFVAPDLTQNIYCKHEFLTLTDGAKALYLTTSKRFLKTLVPGARFIYDVKQVSNIHRFRKRTTTFFISINEIASDGDI